MRWSPGGRSSNIEDRRGGGEEAPPADETPAEKEMVLFISRVLDDAQATWTRLLADQGTSYRDAKLVLFRRVVQSECGVAESAMGPFYCPADEKAYIDLGFYEALRDRFGAPGDFAQAYVLAHEIGHHVQNVLGTSGEVHRLQQGRPSEANELSVMLELQADCYAGVWGHSTNQRQHMEAGDIDEGLRAAAAIGDDRIQSESRGTVNPESFTHGTSVQRVTWLKRGCEAGDPRVCDTFRATR
jgi:predicted metalloprotease